MIIESPIWADDVSSITAIPFLKYAITIPISICDRISSEYKKIAIAVKGFLEKLYGSVEILTCLRATGTVRLCPIN